MGSSEKVNVNYPLAVIREWERGCTCAPKGRPGECQECTDGAMQAVRHWFVYAEKAATELTADDFQAWFQQQMAAGVEQLRNIETFEKFLAQREAENGKNKHA